MCAKLVRVLLLACKAGYGWPHTYFTVIYSVCSCGIGDLVLLARGAALQFHRGAGRFMTGQLLIAAAPGPCPLCSGSLEKRGGISSFFWGVFLKSFGVLCTSRLPFDKIDDSYYASKHRMVRRNRSRIRNGPRQPAPRCIALNSSDAL